MLTRNKNILAFIYALLLLCTYLSMPLTAEVNNAAERDNGGNAIFFIVPASAAALGHGTAASSGAMDASDIYRFTANSALADGTQLIIGRAGHNRSKTGVLYGALAMPVFYSGTVGLFGHNIASDIYGTSNTFGLSLAGYSREYGYGFGGHVAFTQSDILCCDNMENFVGFGADFRVDPHYMFSGRAYYLHSGIPMRSKDWNPFLGRADRLAEQYGLIVNYYPLRGISDYWGTMLGVGTQKTFEQPIMLGVSSELSVDGRFFARFGYESSIGSERSVSRGSIGMGFLISGFGVDGAYMFSHRGGGRSYAVNAKYNIEMLKKRNAEDNLTLANRHFEKERYGTSAHYARSALAVDSMHWNAQAILQKSNASMARAKSNNITIIYGGNSRGQVIPFPPSSDALGGLSRHAAVVSSLRRANPVNFAVDVGNILSAENHELRVELIANYYDLMNFDIIALGGGEAAMGPFEFMRTQKRSLPIIITNLNNNDSEQSGIWSSLLLTKEEHNVYFLNILCASVLNDSIAPDFAINTAAIKSQLTGQYAARAHLRIAIIHGNMHEIQRIAETLPELDVIIAGSLDERFDTPMRIGQTLIVSAGPNNRFAGCLTVNLGESVRRRQFTAENKLYPVYQDIAPKPEIENITRLVSAAIRVERSRIGVLSGRDRIPVAVSGVIPHLSERGGETLAFIKATGSKAEYPLGEDFTAARRPIFSPASNRAAFIFGDSAAMNGKLRMIDLSIMSGRTVSSGKNVLEAALSPADDFLYYIEADSGSDIGAIYKTKMYMHDAITVLGRNNSPRRDLVVSEDGTTLFFTSTDGNGKWHIYATDTSVAAAPIRLTGGNANHRHPRPSSNGNIIAYLSDRNGFGGRMDLWIFERGKNIHKRITVNANVQDFCWGDNSETIYFSSGINLIDINSIDINDMTVRKLITHPANTIKSWSETSLRFIRYGGIPKIIYTREYANGNRRIYRYNILNGKDEAVYAVGDYDEWLDAR